MPFSVEVPKCTTRLVSVKLNGSHRFIVLVADLPGASPLALGECNGEPPL